MKLAISMADKEDGVPCGLEDLFSRGMWHILEKIFFSLDYKSYKKCLGVNKVWHELLTSESYQRKGKSVFHDELLKEEHKLHDAMYHGDAHEVRRLISTKMLDVNCVKGWDASTPLSEAACNGHYEIIQLLLNSGADPNKANTITGFTPLHWATIEDNIEVAQLLLDSGADPNTVGAVEYGAQTPLHQGALHGNKYLVQLLLNRGADRTKVNSFGLPPLDLANLGNHEDTAKVLEDAGS